MKETLGAGSSRPPAVNLLGPCPRCTSPLEGETSCAACGFQAPDPRIGLVLGEKFRIESILGEGGMGIVYRGSHLALGEPVAIKFLRPKWVERSEFRARFRREAVILARLRHPAIVSILDFGELENEPFMVMELISGSPFADVIQRGGVPIPWIRVGPIFDEILGVLEASHAAGIIHRDMKPENVMLLDATDRVDRIKVLDFGIAYLDEPSGAVSRLTETGTVRGTPQYMSPEQCRGSNITTATDVYATAVMLFEATTGTLPFDAQDVAGMMVQHMFVEPPRLADSGVKPVVTRGLEELVRAGLAKTPEQRPTAREFREELARVVRGTDLASFQDVGTKERQRAAALSRSDRAITGLGAVAAEAPVPLDGRVVVMLVPDLVASPLRSALAVHGIVARQADATEVDSVSAHDQRPVGALVVDAAEANVGNLLQRARSSSLGDLPILCIRASGAEAVATLVRIGASDVSLAGASTEDISRKVRRLLRRGR